MIQQNYLQELMQKQPQEIRAELLEKKQETIISLDNKIFTYFELPQHLISNFPNYTFSKTNKEQKKQEILMGDFLTISQYSSLIPAEKWKLNGAPIPEMPITYAIIISDAIRTEYKPYFALHEFLKITNTRDYQDSAIALRDEIKTILGQQERELVNYARARKKITNTTHLRQEIGALEFRQKQQLRTYIRERQNFFKNLMIFAENKQVFTQEEQTQFFHNEKALGYLNNKL